MSRMFFTFPYLDHFATSSRNVSAVDIISLPQGPAVKEIVWICIKPVLLYLYRQI